MVLSELFIFDTVVNFIIIIASFLLFRKTREIYKLSLQKGVKYLSYAMLFYVFSFSIRYIELIFSNFFPEHGTLIIVLIFINLFCAAMGGFYLGYCLMWRRFETSRRKPHYKTAVFFGLIALFISLFEIYMITIYGITQAYLFFSVMILYILIAIGLNCRHCKLSMGPELNPFLSIVGLGLGVYIAFFIENLLIGILPTIHYYAWAVAAVFTLTFLFYVYKIIEW